MRGLVTILFVLFGALHGSRSHLARSHDSHEMTGNCTSLHDYPEKCVNAEKNVTSVFGTLPEDRNLDEVRSALNAYCTTECIEPYLEYYTCTEEPGLVIYYNNLLCGQSGGEYCGFVYSENVTIDDSIDCVHPNTTCDASCASMQEAVVDAWGCCAASYYAYVGATCNVGAGDPCDGLILDADDAGTVDDEGTVADGGIINRVGLGQIMIFAMVAVSANAVRF